MAWPMMLSTGLFSLTIFVDRLLLYAYSDTAAAGAMGAGTMFWAMTCGPVGLLSITSTFAAQYLGVDRIDRAFRVVIQGMLVAIALGPLILVGVLASGWFFRTFHDPALVEAETTYFHWLAVGAWATILVAPLNGLFAGTGRPMVMLKVDAVITALNAFLDYALIFGAFGLPRWGVAGAGLATSIALVTKLLLMLAFASRRDWDCPPVAGQPAQKLGLFDPSWSWDRELMGRLLRYGWPAAVSSMAEAASFCIIVVLVGKLGEIPMAATTLALGVNMIAFIPMYGLGQAVGVLVGQRLTSQHADLAKRSVRSGLMIGIAYSSLFALAYGLIPHQVLNVYAWGTEPARFEEMRPIVIPLLWFIAAYCIFDAIQIIFVAALKGAGDTSYILWGNVLCGSVSVLVGKLCGDYLHGGLYWWWGIITFWVLSLAAIFGARYRHGGWLSKRVIEAELQQ